MIVSTDLLHRAGVPAPIAAAWAGPLTAACQANGITTAQRLAGLLANILHETTGLADLVESLDYSADALVEQWPGHFAPTDAQRIGRTAQHPADQQAIAERAYGSRMGNVPGSGDGFRFRGHGPLQLTGRIAYVRFAKSIAWAQPLEALPAYVCTVAGGSNSAAQFWRVQGCNAYMDRSDLAGCRRAVNGGTIGLADVQARYGLIRGLLDGAVPLPVAHPASVVQVVESPTTAELNDAEAARVR